MSAHEPRIDVVVIGFGVTGRAVARALTRSGQTVMVFDDSASAEQAGVAESIGVPLEPTPRAPELVERLRGATMVV
ncbi:MAG TPA: NAD(P)-binding domain-containing protein, partial [Acidimicrobiales bacterium]|nr:NAD(P)-binding domain-containing protein [Acidimicrobiales bacterium]